MVETDVEFASDGRAFNEYTAGTIALGSTQTRIATATLRADCPQPFEQDTIEVYNYHGFNFPEIDITDAEHVDSSAMSQQQIQQFLDARDSFLTEFYINVNTLEGFYDTDGNGTWEEGEPLYNDVGEEGFSNDIYVERVSDTIRIEATLQGINPKILLTTMQKERGLISRSTVPAASTLDDAMGCAQSDPSLQNFYGQIVCAAQTFRNRFYDTQAFGRALAYPFYFEETDGFRHHTGSRRVNVSFFVANTATYAQYRYTPHVQSQPTGGGVHLFDTLWRTAYGF